MGTHEESPFIPPTQPACSKANLYSGRTTKHTPAPGSATPHLSPPCPAGEH